MKRGSVLPGFGLTLGITGLYLGLIVLIPLAALLLRTATLSWSELWAEITDPRAIASYQLSFGASLIAGLVNAVFGLLVAWVLVRYEFPGRTIVDAMVDLPFALPTAVAGLTLTTLYAETGPLGRTLEDLGLPVAFRPLGVVVALSFVGLPFVVRTVQPVLQDLDPALEESGALLGASRLQVFRKILLPNLLPALLTGFALSFSRAVGEYGSVVFISGNIPFRTEITPFLIVTKLEQYDYAAAAAIASVMLVASFILLLAINLLQRWGRKRQGIALR